MKTKKSKKMGDIVMIFFCIGAAYGLYLFFGTVISFLHTWNEHRRLEVTQEVMDKNCGRYNLVISLHRVPISCFASNEGIKCAEDFKKLDKETEFSQGKTDTDLLACYQKLGNGNL